MQTHLATLLSVSLLGRLVIMNCVDSVANGAISRDLAGEFIREWAKRCADVTNPAEIFGKLRILRETDPRFRASTGRAIPAFRNSVFTVIEYARLFNQLHADTLLFEISELHSLAMDFSNCCDEGSRQELEKDILAAQDKYSEDGFVDIRFIERQTIKVAGNKLIWFSSAMPGIPLTDTFSHHQTADHGAADIARDSFGLVHLGFNYEDGRRNFPLMVALKIDAREFFEKAAVSAIPWRPTVIDAEQHTRFRAAFGDLRRKAGVWGRAIHLEQLSDRAGLLGAEEAVVPDFRPQTPRMTFLGYPRAPRNDFPGVNDDQFVANIQRRRNRSTLLDKFLEICA